MIFLPFNFEALRPWLARVNPLYRLSHLLIFCLIWISTSSVQFSFISISVSSSHLLLISRLRKININKNRHESSRFSFCLSFFSIELFNFYLSSKLRQESAMRSRDAMIKVKHKLRGRTRERCLVVVLFPSIPEHGTNGFLVIGLVLPRPKKWHNCQQSSFI